MLAAPSSLHTWASHGIQSPRSLLLQQSQYFLPKTELGRAHTHVTSRTAPLPPHPSSTAPLSLPLPRLPLLPLPHPLHLLMQPAFSGRGAWGWRCYRCRMVEFHLLWKWLGLLRLEFVTIEGINEWIGRGRRHAYLSIMKSSTSCENKNRSFICQPWPRTLSMPFL